MHLKTDKVDFKKSHHEKEIAFFLQSHHQVDMKNVVECPREFFAYFNASVPCIESQTINSVTITKNVF